MSRVLECGAYVRVVAAADSTLDQKYMGRWGRVLKMEFGTAGVGDGPDDPFIHVVMPATRKRKPRFVDGFWREELKVVRKPRRRRR